MSKIFLQKALAPDTVLGRVEPNGNIYVSQFGPDRRVGRVELDTGKIFESRLGPDAYVGQVNLDSGKVYRHKPLAPDEYMGSVDTDGKLYRQKPLAPDEYVGRMETMLGLALGGAALVLLVLPVLADNVVEKPKAASD